MGPHPSGRRRITQSGSSRTTFQPVASRHTSRIARASWAANTIDAMPPRMRDALRQFRVEGWSQRAIAEGLGITVSGVEKLLKRAYRQIHDRLNDDSAEVAGPRRLTVQEDTSDGA